MITTKYDPNTDASITLTLKILKNRQYGLISGDNLCKEIFFPTGGAFFAPYIPNFMTKPKYQFSRAKWYEAEFDWGQQTEVLEWCKQQFGPHPKFPDAWSRWHNRYQGKIYFRDERDYQWFVLRWGA